MKRLSIPLRVIFTFLVIAMLAACAPGEAPPSAEDIQAQVATSVAQTVEAQGQIATSVALTVAAQEAERAAANPTETPTATLPPTMTPVLVTATPVTLVPPAGGGGGGGGTSGGGGGLSQYEYSCDWIHARPYDNTEYRRTHTFDVTFTILNNGTKTWEAGKDLVLVVNPKGTLLNPPGTIELPKMKPGDTFVVGPFDAQAPDEPGRYVIEFKLEGGWCRPTIVFNVTR